MKKKIWFYALAMACTMNLFTACSDDDDNPWTEVAGTYTGETLELTCNGSQKESGSVVLTGNNASIQIDGNVLPGETQSITLNGISYDGSQFSGTASTTLYNVTVSGTKENDILKLNLTTELNETGQGGIAGTWNLSLQYPYTIGEEDENWNYPKYENPCPPIRLDWPAIQTDKTNGEQCAMVLSNLCSHLLSEVVQNITLPANGSLQASYYTAPMFEWQYDVYSGTWKHDESDGAMMQWMVNSLLVVPTTTPEEAPSTLIPVYDRTWITSPTGLMSWYTKGEYIYLLPNIEAIMKQVTDDQGTIANGEIDLDAILKKLAALGIDQGKLAGMLPQIMDWLTNGVPLKYKVDDDTLSLYVDKDMAAPFMELLLPALPGLWDEVLKADPTGMAGMAVYLLGVSNIADLQTIWETNTKDFSITLCFKKK